MHPCINATISIIKKLQYNFSKNSSDLVAGSFPNGQLHGKTHVTRLGSLIWQSPSHGKTQRDILGKTHGTIQGSITWQNPLNGKSHWDIHGKNHGTKIVILDVGWRQRQYTFWTAIMIFWGLIHTSLWISLDKNGLFGKVRVFEGKHSQDWAEIAENEEICDLHDKNGGLRFFWQLVQLNYALVSQMGCLELFIFENGQPMTTPPPKVYFWAFRLTVNCFHILWFLIQLVLIDWYINDSLFFTDWNCPWRSVFEISFFEKI